MNAPSASTAVPSTRTIKRTQLREYLDQNRPVAIQESEWQDLLGRLAPISESYLRRLLRSSGIPLSALVEGVRQDSFEELERTLLAIHHEYARDWAAGDRERARAYRRLVILAKDHARWAVRNPKTPPEKKAEKEEMILWMLTWLENPGAFATWLRLRKASPAGIPASVTAPGCRR